MQAKKVAASVVETANNPTTSKVLVTTVHHALFNPFAQLIQMEGDHPLKGSAVYMLNYLNSVERLIEESFGPSKLVNLRVDTCERLQSQLDGTLHKTENLIDAYMMLQVIEQKEAAPKAVKTVKAPLKATKKK